MSNRRFAGQRVMMDDVRPLMEALGPMRQQGGKNAPYFAGTNEERWMEQQGRLHKAINEGRISQSDLAHVLKINNPERGFNEARSFMEWSRKNPQTRHQYYGVPHAYSSENVYKELLNASGNPTKMNNLGEATATDLVSNIDGRDQYVDVQNRSAAGTDVLSLGLIQGLRGRDIGAGTSAWRQARNSTPVRDILNTIDKNTDGRYNLDKLTEGRNQVRNEAYAKDYLIGGKYQYGDVNNLIGDPSKGGFDFVRPRQVDLVDMNRLREDVLHMSKGDLMNSNAYALDSSNPNSNVHNKLKLGIPMDLIDALGALRNDKIDPELMKLVQRGG